MKRSFVEGELKKLGVEIEENKIKEFVDSIMTEAGNDLNIQKTKTETVQNDLKVKEGLIEELNAKIKKLDSVDIEKIKEESFKQGKAEGSKEFDDFKKTNALKASIKGAKDFDLVKSKLNLDNIEYEKDEKGEYKVKGIDEQLKSIKETYSYLFEDDNTNNVQNINLGGNHNGNIDIDSDVKAVAKAMGLET